MLNVTRLWAGAPTPGDALRYGEPQQHGGPPRQPTLHHRPVVMWNITRACNLHCFHCALPSQLRPAADELSTAEALEVVDQLARHEVPALILTGGEPLVRPDLLTIARHAAQQGLRVSLSTNGTLLTPAVLAALKRTGVAYIGISVDGPEAVHDKIRGSRGAYFNTITGIRSAVSAGFRVGIRLLLTRYNDEHLAGVFDIAEREGVSRVCIYHLAYAGRGARIRGWADLNTGETRRAMDVVLERADQFHARGLPTEVLTAANHSDAVYLAARILKERPDRAAEVITLLRRNGGNSSGVGVCSIGPTGNVHADEFSLHRSFGNVLERPFDDIWENADDPFLAGLRSQPRPLKGRCGTCPALPLCNGNLRIRAEAATGDPWASDPACYVTDDEAQRVGRALAAGGMGN